MIGAALLVLVGWLPPAPPAQADDARTVLTPAGNPYVIMSDDFDGDGDGDLLMVDGRQVSVFLFGGGAMPTMPSRPSLVFSLAKNVVFVDGSDIDGDFARELLALTPTGVVTYGFRGGELSGPNPVAALQMEETFLSAVPDGDVCWNDIFLDVDGSGVEDALLPTERGFRVFLRSGDSLEFRDAGLVPIVPTGSIEFSPASDFGCIEQTTEMPRIFTGDVDGDGRNEVLTFDGRVVTAYRQPERDGDVWPRSFARVLYDMNESFREEMLSSRNVRVNDLDGAGKSCLLVVRALDGEINFLDGDGLENRRTLRLEGWALPPRLINLDGDGRIDLLAPTIEEIGHLKLMKTFVSRSLEMRYSIFRNRENVRYARTPDEVREITFPLDYESIGGSFSVENQMIYAFAGDFDGDGLKDFLIKQSPTELAVYRGVGGASFTKKPSATITIDDTTPYLTVNARIWDFDRDGRDDLFLHYQARGGGEDSYVVRMSRLP